MADIFELSRDGQASHADVLRGPLGTGDEPVRMSAWEARDGDCKLAAPINVIRGKIGRAHV